MTFDRLKRRNWPDWFALLLIFVVILVVFFGLLMAVATVVQAHVLYPGQSYMALKGYNSDNDIQIKRKRLEAAFGVDIVNNYSTSQWRTGDHTVGHQWRFVRANGKFIDRIFVSRLRDDGSISDYPLLPY